jgi:hypothetical protein
MKNAKKVAVLAVAIVLVGGGGLVHAGQTQAIPDTQYLGRQSLEQIPVETYQYGMQLDIARVRTISDTSRVCGVVPSVMHYEDSEGELRALQYLISGGGCHDH